MTLIIPGLENAEDIAQIETEKEIYILGKQAARVAPRSSFQVRLSWEIQETSLSLPA